MNVSVLLGKNGLKGDIVLFGKDKGLLFGLGVPRVSRPGE